MVDCIVHAEGKSALTPRAPCPSPQSQDSVPHSSIPGIHAWLSPEFLIELAGLAVVGSLGSAVVVEGSHCQVVHVEPDGSPPVWGVVICVPLIGKGGLGNIISILEDSHIAMFFFIVMEKVTDKKKCVEGRDTRLQLIHD